jgi:hypothetical protein
MLRHFQADSIFASNALSMYLNNIQESIKTGNRNSHKSTIDALVAFQYKYGNDILPSEFKIKSEILYNNLNIFQRLSSFYGLIGFVLLILQFIGVFFKHLKGIIKLLLLILACFIIHFWGLVCGMYQVFPDNGYESMVYIVFPFCRSCFLPQNTHSPFSNGSSDMDYITRCPFKLDGS